MDTCGKIIFLIFCAFFSAIECRDEGKLDSSDQDAVECLKDTGKIADAANKGELWALKILDASTKLPSGILTGHVMHYGNYDECLADEYNVTTQHCFVNFRPKIENVPDFAIKWSYCVPKSCSPKLLESIVQDLVANFSMNVTVNPSDCQSRRMTSLTTRDYIGISIWGIFISLAVLSTAYDVICRQTKAALNPVLSSFSIYTNGARLLNTKSTAETMMPLHGLRFLSICWIMLGHRCFFTLFSPILNLIDLVNEFKKVQTQLIVQSILAVDSFFLLSGFLNCYHLLNILNKTHQFPVIRYYIHRYLRLTPALAAIVLMYATWFSLIGDGPAWNQMTSQGKQLCVDYWWTTLLYINNYYNPTSQCAGQAWYLAVDMQLYWLSPLIILPLWKWPRYGKLCLGLLLVLSVVSVFVVAFIYEFRAPLNIGLTDFEEFLKATKQLYVPTHTRATPYVFGIILGHYLYNLRRSGRTLNFSKVFVGFGWLSSTAFCLSIIFGNFQFTRPIEEHPYNRLESSFYISLYRVGWCYGISWIILTCLNERGGIINKILSWKAFVPLSRLTYCIYLCHMSVQQYQLATARSTDYFGYFNLFERYFGDLAFSLIFAAMLSLIFESPFLVLEKLFATDSGVRNMKSEVNEGYEEESSGSDKDEKIFVA